MDVILTNEINDIIVNIGIKEEEWITADAERRLFLDDAIRVLNERQTRKEEDRRVLLLARAHPPAPGKIYTSPPTESTPSISEPRHSLCMLKLLCLFNFFVRYTFF